MRPDSIDYLIKLVKTRSGLLLTPEKQYLLESRLLPIARSRNLQNLDALVQHLKAQSNETLLVEITEAMTTNESSFFRDGKPFENFRQHILPLVRKQVGGRQNLRIWSAASSTGQEPYTIAMTLMEENAPGWKHEILATDLAGKVLDKAKQGVYSQFEAQRGMPIQLLLKYFTQLPDTSWQIKENVKSMVKFQPQNLLENFAGLGKFDIIFCRNVLIYFDEPTKLAVVERMCANLQPNGVLILGSTESIMDKNTRLKAIESMRGMYQLT